MSAPIYVNKTTTNGRQEYAEMQKRYLRSQKLTYYQRIVIVTVMCAVCAAAAALIHRYILMTGLLALTVMTPIIKLKQLDKAIDRAYESQKGLIEGIEKTISFYGDKLETESVKSTLNAAYSEVQKVIECEGYWIFVSNGRLFQVRKGCFTAGDENGFRGFIEEKLGADKYIQMM